MPIYRVNEETDQFKSPTIRSFICAILVFLVLCGILLLFLLIETETPQNHYHKKLEKSDSESFKGGVGGVTEKYIVIKVENSTKSQNFTDYETSQELYEDYDQKDVVTQKPTNVSTPLSKNVTEIPTVNSTKFAYTTTESARNETQSEEIITVSLNLTSSTILSTLSSSTEGTTDATTLNYNQITNTSGSSTVPPNTNLNFATNLTTSSTTSSNVIFYSTTDTVFTTDETTTNYNTSSSISSTQQQKIPSSSSNVSSTENLYSTTDTVFTDVTETMNVISSQQQVINSTTTPPNLNMYSTTDTATNTIGFTVIPSSSTVQANTTLHSTTSTLPNQNMKSTISSTIVSSSTTGSATTHYITMILNQTSTSSTTSTTSVSLTCSKNEFKCRNGFKCVKDYHVCDGVDECGDGSDEQNCINCNQNEFTCSDKTCIPLSYRCDGIPNCYDGSDEFSCTTTTTRSKPAKSKLKLKTSTVISTSCKTDICSSRATRMLNLMNHTETPCSNFYEFACGGGGVDDDADADNMNMLTYLYSKRNDKWMNQFYKFYSSCVQYERDFKYMERFKNFVDYINDKTIDEFSDALITQSIPFITIGLDIEKNIYKLQLIIGDNSATLKTDLEEFGIFQRAHKFCVAEQKMFLYDNNVQALNLTSIHDKYETCKFEQLKVIIRNFGMEMKYMFQYIPNMVDNETEAIFETANINNTITFLDIMKNISSESSTTREDILTKLYKYHSISNIQTVYPFLPWLKIFSKISKETYHNQDQIQVYNLDFLDVLRKRTPNFSNKTLSDIFNLLRFTNIYENTVMPKGKKHCINLSKKLMPDISSVIYKQIHYNSTKQETFLNKTFEKIKNTFSTSLNRSTNIEDGTKITFLKKLEQLSLLIVGIDNDNLFLQNLYSRYFGFNISDQYQKNVIDLLRNYKRNLYTLADKTVIKDSLCGFYEGSFGSISWTVYGTDLIVVPPNIFKNNPIDLPPYLIEYTIGVHLAKQIAKHFDNIGIKFLIPDDSDLIHSVYSDLIFSTTTLITSVNYTISGRELRFEIDNSLSSNDLFAENTAFRMVTDMVNLNHLQNIEKLQWISKTYSDSQIVLIATAQEYCDKSDPIDFMIQIYNGEQFPASIRVTNIMSHSMVFGKSYSCPIGSALNQEEDLKVQFPYFVSATSANSNLLNS